MIIILLHLIYTVYYDIPCACVHIQSHSKIVFKKRATNVGHVLQRRQIREILKCPSEVLLTLSKLEAFVAKEVSSIDNITLCILEFYFSPFAELYF